MSDHKAGASTSEMYHALSQLKLPVSFIHEVKYTELMQALLALPVLLKLHKKLWFDLSRG